MNNLFRGIPAELPEEFFQTLVEGDGVRVERIVSRGHQTAEGDWLDQEWHEWVVVLRGAARLQFSDGHLVELNSGDFLKIAAHQRHRVAWTAEDRDTVWLAVHFRP